MRLVTGAILEITKKCNLKCSYCYLGDCKQEANMSFKVAERIIMWVLENCRKNNTIPIFIFMGGEPLMNFSLIKWIVLKCEVLTKKGYPKARFCMTTNGTLLSIGIAKFLSEKSVITSISLDGTFLEHDKYRKFNNDTGSFDLILNNIRILKKHNLTEFFTVRTTITSTTKSINEIIDFYDNEGIGTYRFSTVTVDKNNNCSLSTKQVRIHAYNLVENFRHKLVNEKKIKDVTLNTILVNILSKMKRTYSCLSGLTYVGVGYDGSIYPCHRFFETENYKIGNVFELSNWKKNKSLLHVDKRNECKVCSIKYICGGTCYYECRDDNSQIEEISCEFNKIIIKELIKLAIFLTTKRKDILKIFLSNNKLVEAQDPININKMQLNDNLKKFIRSKKAVIIELDDEGILYLNDNKYIVNTTSMAIWDLLDGDYTAQEIAQEIADICEVPVVEIEEDIYQQLGTFQELGFIEEVKETA